MFIKRIEIRDNRYHRNAKYYIGEINGRKLSSIFTHEKTQKSER